MLDIILNPISRAGMGSKIWAEMEPRLKDIEYSLHKTEYEGHATLLAQELTKSENETTLIVVGGDGTLNEVITGIKDLSKVTIGYVPLGTGNDFARGTRLETDPFKMLEYVLDPKEYKEVDIGYILYDNGVKRRFSISSGFGWEADICAKADIDSSIKKFLNKIGLGSLTYTVLAFRILFRYPRFKVKIRSNGKEYRYNNVLFAAAMNLAYEGGGLMFRPDAGSDTGKLHMIVAHDMGYIKTALILTKAFKGKHVKHVDKIGMFDFTDASLISDTPKNIHVDGQALPARDAVEYHIEKDRLRIITG